MSFALNRLPKHRWSTRTLCLYTQTDAWSPVKEVASCCNTVRNRGPQQSGFVLQN